MTQSTETSPPIAVIGAGPAGLMAADILSAQGRAVAIYDAMPSFARKFLMAGKSGLNISHAEPPATFRERYMTTSAPFRAAIDAFGRDEVRAFMDGLGIDHFTGPTGRIFPDVMKASPLLRAWLIRLERQGVSFHRRHRWTGWDDSGNLTFETEDGPRAVDARAAVLALGGASWRRLGSDGEWTAALSGKGVSLAPFIPSNGGITTAWSDHMVERFAGTALKNIALSTGKGRRALKSRGECVITRHGLESGAVYTIFPALRTALATGGKAHLTIDLCPDVSSARLITALARQPAKLSLANRLRRGARLSPVKIAMLHETTPKDQLASPETLAAAIKAVPLPVTGLCPLDEAISTGGGVTWNALDENFMLTELPGVFCAGEMVAWDAPTGGYLLTACLATGKAAADGLSRWLDDGSKGGPS